MSKTKWLKNLNSLSTWLRKQDLLSDQGLRAIADLEELIESAPDEVRELEKLPPPAELKDLPHAIAIYTDGACKVNPGPGAWAYVIQDASGEVWGEGTEVESQTTNNRMEISGVIHGLDAVKSILKSRERDPLLTEVLLMSDSKYVVEGLNSWVAGWKARGWKKADNKVPENVELWQRLDEVAQGFMSLKLIWVKGHAGHPQNEHCDRLCNQALSDAGF